MPRTHLMRKTSFYHIWTGILRRCRNPNDISFPNYGGRGITVEWKSFEEFAKDMYVLYVWHVMIYGQKDTLIERKDNDGNYSKANCKWSTIHEQTCNRRNNRIFTYNGQTHTMKDWASILGINYHTLHNRINVEKWDWQKAFTTRAFKGRNQFTPL